MSTYLDKAKCYVDPQNLHNYAMNGLNAALADAAIPFRKANILGAEALSLLSGTLVAFKETGRASLKSAEKIFCSNVIYLIQFAKEGAFKDKLKEVKKYEIKAGFTPAVNQFYGVAYAIKALVSEILFFAMASLSQENVDKQKDLKNFAPVENELAKLTAQIKADDAAAATAKADAIAAAVKEKQDAIDDLNTQIQALRDGKAADIATAIADKQQEITKLETEIQALKTQHQTALDAAIQAKDQEISSAKTNIITLEGQITGLNTRLGDLQQKLDAADAELDVKQNVIGQLEKRRDGAESAFADKTLEYEDLKKQLEQVKRDLAAARQKAEAAPQDDAHQATVTQLIEDKAALEAQVDGITKQLEASEADYKKAKEELAQATADLATSRQEFEAAVNKIADQKEALAKKEKECQDANKELDANEDQIDNLKKEKEALATKYKGLKQQKNEQVEQFNDLNDRFTNQGKVLQATQNEKKDLDVRFTAQGLELHATREALEKLQEQVSPGNDTIDAGTPETSPMKVAASATEAVSAPKPNPKVVKSAAQASASAPSTPVQDPEAPKVPPNSDKK